MLSNWRQRAIKHLTLAFNAINGVETIDIENLEIKDGAVPSINKSAKIERKFMFSESELRQRLSKTEFEVTQEVQWEDRNKGPGFHELNFYWLQPGNSYIWPRTPTFSKNFWSSNFQNGISDSIRFHCFGPWIPAKDDI